MECLTEFTCSVYADGELPEPDSRHVEEHLASCPSCRKRMAAFREENRLLVHCIQGIDWKDSSAAVSATRQVARTPLSVAPAPRRSDVAKVGGMLLGIAAVIRLAMSSPKNFVFPASPVSLDWLDPSNLSGSLNWLSGAISLIATEGVSQMTLVMNGLSIVALFALIFAGLVVLIRRSAGRGALVSTLATLATIVLIVACSPSSYAMDIRHGGKDSIMTIPSGETIDDSLFVTGDTVIVDGTVNGDVIAFARRVTINGTVKGNVITGGQSIDVGGTVEGSVLAASQTIQIQGHVNRSAYAFSQSTNVGKDASIGGDLTGAGNEIHVNGSIAHNFYAYGFAEVTGIVGRNVEFHGASISLLPSARVGGNLTSHVQRAESVHIAPGAAIGGKQTIDLQIRTPGPNKYATFGFYFSAMLRLAAAFITGFILMLVFPRLRHARFDEAVSVLKSAGVGFLAIVAMPIAALVVFVTFIGIPVALVGITAWALGLYLAKIVVANFVGRTLVSTESDRLSALALHLFVGLLLLFIAINLPYIGGLLHSFLVLIGFGALVMNVYDAFHPVDFAAGSGK